jgi:hypothetical protein
MLISDWIDLASLYTVVRWKQWVASTNSHKINSDYSDNEKTTLTTQTPIQATKEEEKIENTNSHNKTAVRRGICTWTSPNTSWS